MNHPQKPNDQYNQGFDVGDFRYAVASLCRHLICARETIEPGFLASEEYTAWGLGGIGSDRDKLLWLLQQAHRDILEINDTFLLRCGSGGIAVEEKDPLADFKRNVASLVDHLYDLPNAIKSARKGDPVNLRNLVRWDTLSKIRKTLDTLPHPKAAGKTDSSLPLSDVPGQESPWRVEHKSVSYNDECIQASGIPMRILRALVESHRPMTRSDLEAVAWPEGTVVTSKTLDKHLSLLRGDLRDALGLAAEVNPIPSETFGPDAVWSLAKNLDVTGVPR